MTPQRTAFVALFALLFITAPALAQNTTPDTSDAFWNRFEDEVNRFVKSMTTDFLAQHEQVDSTDHDSAATPMHTGPSSPADSARVDETGTNPPHTDMSFGSENFTSARGSRNERRDDATTFFRRPVVTPLPWMSESINPHDVIFRYNRVEGIFLGLGSGKLYFWDGENVFAPYGSIGYGFSAHRWRGNLGFARQIAIGGTANDQLMEVGIEGYSLADSKDRWRIGTGENTAAAFLIHEDFRYYFGREGFSLHSSYFHRTRESFAEGSITFLADRYQSLAARTDWALFGGDKVFRSNPRIDDGIMRSIIVLGGFSSAAGTRRGPDGWNMNASAEFADNHAFGGEFNFNQYVVDIRRYQPMGEFDNINVRLRAGTSHGILPRQKTFELGGLGSIPAFPFKSAPGDTLGGNRMILFNAEYSVNGDFLGDLSFWPSFIMRHVNFLFLADAGVVRSAGDDARLTDGFGGMHWSEFATDLGLGLANRSGSFRIAVVWRTDRSEPARFVLRLERPF
jgi:hypothetical protein